MRLVAPTGRTKNSPTARTTEKTTVPIHAPLEISSASSPSWALAEMPSALKPIFSDSARATTPRMTGRRKARWAFSQETSGKDSTRMSPVGTSPASWSMRGRRLATAHVETPRIITPSSTACPPTGASRPAIRRPSGRRVALKGEREGSGGCAGPPLGGAALEALDAPAGVDQLLPARVERMAVRADLDVNLGLRGARGELVAARKANVRLHVLRVDFGLHSFMNYSGGDHPRIGP